MYLVLIVTLVLIKGEVFVYILQVWTCLVTGIITLRTVISIRRVSLRVVDKLISVEDALALVVVVCAAETVIVVTGWVVIPCLKDTVAGNDSTQFVEPVLICPEAPFLIIVKTIESHILTCPGA